jgi:hypothetical protein
MLDKPVDILREFFIKDKSKFVTRIYILAHRKSLKLQWLKKILRVYLKSLICPFVKHLTHLYLISRGLKMRFMIHVSSKAVRSSSSAVVAK